MDLVKPGGRKALRLTGRVVRIVQPESAALARTAPGIAVEFDVHETEVVTRLQELLAGLGVQTGMEGSGEGIGSEVQPHARPEVQPQAQAAVQPKAQAAVQPQAKTAVQPHAQTEVQTRARKDVRPRAPGRTQVQAQIQTQGQPAAGNVAEDLAAPASGSSPLAPELFEGSSSGAPTIGIAAAAASSTVSPQEVSATGPVADAGSDSARLMVQIRGLLFELGEVRARLEEREAELREARAELARLRGTTPPR
jgi:hypothetical protein